MPEILEIKVTLVLSEATTGKKYAYVDANGVVSWSKETSVTGSTQIASLENGTLTLATDHSKYNIAVSGGTGYTADTTIAGLAAKDSVDAAGFKATVSTGVAGVSYTNVDDSDSIVLADEDSVTFASTAKADTKVTLPASATNGITVGTKTYKTGTAGTKLTVAKSGTVTLGTANDEVTIDGVKYVATTGESITIDSEGNAVAPVNTKVTITTAEEGATAVAYEATTGTITVAKTGVATIEAGEAAKVGDVAYASTSGTITVDKDGPEAKAAKLELSGATTEKKYAYVDANGVVSWSATDNDTSAGTKIASLESGTLTLVAHSNYNIAVSGGTGYTADTTITGLAEKDSVDAAGFNATVSAGVGGVSYTNVDDSDSIALADEDSVTFASSAKADTKVTLPASATKGITVGTKTYKTGATATKLTVAKSGTVTLGTEGDEVTIDGVEYVATTGMSATAVKLEFLGATAEKKYAYVDANGGVSWSDQETGGTGTKIATLDNGTLTLETHADYNIAVSSGTGYTTATTISGLAAKDSVDAAGFKATVSTGVGGVSYTNVDDGDNIALADEDSVTFASTAKADTKVTLPASAAKGITVGTKTYKTGTAATDLTVAKSGTVTLGAANDEVTIDGVKYVATKGESITIDSEGNAVAPVNTKVTITTAEEGAAGVAYAATTGTITVGKTGVATIEAGEAAKVGGAAGSMATAVKLELKRA